MPRVKKIVDISPPRQKKQIAPVSHSKTAQRKFLHFKAVLALGIFCLGIFVFAVQYFFVSASVMIWPRFRDVQAQEVIFVDANQSQPDTLHLVLPGKLFQAEKSAAKLFQATGSRLEATKARGAITVFNNQQKLQILVSTTRFISQDGKLFRSLARAVIAPGTSQDIQVEAAEPGSDYNIGPSNFSLPGLAGTPLYTLVYGKSSQKMAGGEQKKVTIVSSSDIEQAKSSLGDTLVRAAKADLVKQITDPWTIENSPFAMQTLEAVSLVQEGAALSQFNVRERVRVSALAFQNAQVLDLVQHILDSQVQPDETLNAKSIHTEVTPKDFNASSFELSLALFTKGHIFEQLDPASVKAEVLGKSRNAVFSFLRENQKIARFELSLFPFWLSHLPSDEKRIQVQFLLD